LAWVPTVIVVLFVLLLFVAMLGFLELGRRLGERWAPRDPSAPTRGTAAVEGAVFALMGLLIAFTFSAAQSRLDKRRALVVDEANAIGTAYLRLDLLPGAAQPGLRDAFRAYTDSRIAYYKQFKNQRAAAAERERTVALGKQIWRDATAAVKAIPDPRVPSLLVPSLNEVIDIEATRVAYRHIHAPVAIFFLLIVLAFACALFAGVGMGRKEIFSQLYRTAFAILLTVTVLVIVDIEFPRVGFININALDYLLTDVRAGMN
jgi:hypothetical protein